MPLTDNMNQSIPYSVLSDKPNAQTLGEGIVNGLVNRTVMRFASATVRGATITAPKAGMVTFIQDTKLLQIYDGAVWTTVSAQSRSWTNVTVGDGWSSADGSDTNNQQGRLQHRLVNLFGDPTLMLRGGIGRLSYPGSVPSNWDICTLPVGSRPGTLRTLSVACSDTNSDRISLKVDFFPSGIVRLWGTSSTTKPPWVSFNGTYISL